MLERPRSQRQRVAGSLWPESSDTQALTNLRRELHHLKEAWPTLEGLVDAGSRTLAWSGEAGAMVDVVAFEADAERGLAGDRGALHRAARLYTGDILPGCAGEWIDSDRERLRQRARQVLARLVDLLEQDRAFEAIRASSDRALTSVATPVALDSGEAHCGRNATAA
jgi:DNA-binding SARP family transcriptional activator